MNTIKFQTHDESYPLNKDTDLEKYAKTTELIEGERIYHRPFLIKSNEEFQKWHEVWMTESAECHYVGDSIFKAFEKNDPFDCYFEYMCYWDSKDNFHKCLIFCAECFIMNAEGQTVDSFAA